MQTTVIQSAEPSKHVAAQGTRRSAALRPWLAFAAGAVLLLFANGRNSIPIAAWLAPVFLLRFVRLQPCRVWIPALYTVCIFTHVFAFRGMIPIPGVLYYIFLAIGGVLALVPYLADRWLAPRLPAFAAALVFPCVWVMLDFAVSFGPSGTWGSPAYSQFGVLPLLQILSVTGLSGIVFLFGWFAATSNWVWEKGLANRGARQGAFVCFGAIAAVLLLGGARIVFFPPAAPLVRVAALSTRPLAAKLPGAIGARIYAGTATLADVPVARQWDAAVQSDLLARSEREAEAGAKIVFWSEGAAPVWKADEAGFLKRGSELASKYKIYLGMSLGVWSIGPKPNAENKIALIEPSGQIAWQYTKLRPTPGPEKVNSIPGDGKVHVIETPYGRVGAFICYDGDFPQVAAMAGRLNASLMLDPASDWRAIDPWHTQMASFRAIEQGFNLIRATAKGLSAAYDYEGRQLASGDYFRTSDYALVAEVPVSGVRTFYSIAGDWFSWLCMVCFLFLVVRARKGIRI